MTTNSFLAIVLVLATLAGITTSLAVRYTIRARSLQKRYTGIRDIEAKRTSLNEEYQDALTIYSALKRAIGTLEENSEDLSFGLYKPHFDFETPDEYRAKIETVRDQQKTLLRSDGAALCAREWAVGNSKREGSKMTRQVKKLALRAFNGECEAAIADVSWSNISNMEERVRRSRENINKLGTVLQVEIAEQYMSLKLQELWLKYEFEQKRYREREEQRRIREQIREEERAQREIEQAQADAESEEEKYQRALDRAREEAMRLTGAKLDELTLKIQSFEAKLDEARAKKERAIARAQITKSGFVYVISNLGSFGDRVFKIGMTRRLEPMERIYELGGASVPFPFDLHAMLYSDDAPQLEFALHRHFEHKRLNLVNARREFFRDVELSEIESS